MKCLESLVYIVLFFLLFGIMPFLSPHGAYGVETALFQKYNIPKSLQKQPFYYFLQRMEWQAEIAKSGNWIEATLHPSMPKNNTDWSNIHLEISCEYKKKTNEYHITSMDYYLRPIDAPSAWEKVIESGFGFFNEDDIDKDKIGAFLGRYWAIELFATGGPSEFHFSSKMKFQGIEGVGCIVWDEKGNVVYDPYKDVNKDFWDDVYYDEKYVEYLKKTKAECDPVSASWPKDYRLQVPTGLKNKDLTLQSLDRIIGFENAVRNGNVFHLLKELNLEHERDNSVDVEFYFYKNTLAQVRIRNNTFKGRFCSIFDYADDNRLRCYTQGQVTAVDDEGNFQDVLPRYKVGYPKYTINGDGIEVKFHSTGYPARYQTVVNNRLFGRQIEWTEQGEVLSDVDLNIPQPWPDAPKAEADK